MAQPKSKISRSRRGMRNSHTNAKVSSDFPTTCPTTGELHRPHRAFKASDGAIYYKGKQIAPSKDA